MANKRKQIIFDLNTNLMKTYYPKANWRNGYNDINKFMLKNSFEWVQGSSYESKDKMDDIKATILIKQLIEEYPWLNVCMRDCRISDIGKVHNVSGLFDKEAKVKTRLELLQEHSEKALKENEIDLER